MTFPLVGAGSPRKTETAPLWQFSLRLRKKERFNVFEFFFALPVIAWLDNGAGALEFLRVAEEAGAVEAAIRPGAAAL